MFRIDHPTAVAVKPAPGAAGTPGYFTEGDPVGGILPTVVTQAWMNGIQEELMSILTAASVAPSKAASNQVLTALQSLFLRTSDFTGSGNQLLSGNGFQKFPGGLILQWGSVSGPLGGTAAITFPIAFPNEAFHAMSLYVSGTDPGGSVPPTVGGTLFSPLTTTGVNVRFGPGYTTCRFMAWGR